MSGGDKSIIITRCVKILILICLFFTGYIYLKYAFDISDYTGYNFISIYTSIFNGYLSTVQLATALFNIFSIESYHLLGMDFSQKLFVHLIYIPYLIINYAIIHHLSKNRVISLVITAVFILASEKIGVSGGIHAFGYLLISLILYILLIYSKKDLNKIPVVLLLVLLSISTYLTSYNAGGVVLLFLGVSILFLYLGTKSHKIPLLQNIFSEELSCIKCFTVIKPLAISLLAVLFIVLIDSFVYTTFSGFVERNFSLDSFISIISNMFLGSSTVTGDTSSLSMNTSTYNVGGIILYLCYGVSIILNFAVNIFYIRSVKRINSHVLAFLFLTSFIGGWGIFILIRFFIGQMAIGYIMTPAIYSAAMLYGTYFTMSKNKLLSKKLTSYLGALIVIFLVIVSGFAMINTFVENPEFDDDSQLLPGYIAASNWIYGHGSQFDTIYSDVRSLGMIGTYHYSLYHEQPMERIYTMSIISAIITNSNQSPTSGYFLADTYSEAMTFTWDNWDKTTFIGMGDKFDSLPNLEKVWVINDNLSYYRLV